MERDNNPLRAILHFLSYVNVTGDDECWEFLGTRNTKGYGSYSGKRFGYQSTAAHRVSFELFIGPLDADDVVMHRCDNTSCVNPSHLEKGGQSQNTKDGWDRSRGLKLTVDQIRAIYNDPRTQTVIAAEYGIAQSHVSNIKSGYRLSRYTKKPKRKKLKKHMPG